MTDRELMTALNLIEPYVEKIVARLTKNNLSVGKGVCRYVSGSTYYIRMAGSPPPEVATPSSASQLDEYDIIIEKLYTTSTVSQGDIVSVHYCNNMDYSYFVR